MKILVINGITADSQYKLAEKELESAIVNNQIHEIEYFRLRDMNINFCTGCWSCWYKTPGYCSIKDDYEQILSRIPDIDQLIFVTPIIRGYESSLIKTAKDRIIPMAHPYIRIYKGEFHHCERYEKMPKLGVILVNEDNTASESNALIKQTYNRMALNFATTLSLFESTKESGGISNVINNI